MAAWTPSEAVGLREAGFGSPATNPATRRAEDSFVFSRWIRYAGVAYLLVAVTLCGLLVSAERGERAYLTSLSTVALVFAGPGLVVALVTSRRVAAADRLPWRLWALMFVQGCLSAWLIHLHVAGGWDGLRRWTVPSVVTVIVSLVVGNTVMTRLRSGQRAALIDAVDLLMATLAVTVPAALVAAEAIVTSPHAWFTTSAALWAVAATHGTFVALVIASRLRPGERGVAFLGAALGVTVVANSLGQVVQGLHDFRLPPGPFVALHALCVGLAVQFFLWSHRRPSSGLDRLPPRDQVRRRSTISVLILVAVPVIGVEGLWRRQHGWAVVTAGAAVLALLALSSTRHLLSARETARLYGEVERAADERGRLLADVMAHVDADRHRVAAQLHRQAVSLYTAMVSFISALDRAVDGAPTVVGAAAQRISVDLARQVDELRQIATAVQPLPRAGGGADRLAALVRAYVENLYGDAPRPDVAVEVDPEVVLDWALEAIVLRIVQEATHNVWRHAHASSLAVSVTASSRSLEVEVVDDGVGFCPERAGRGIATMRAVAGFVGGELEVVSAPGRGTRVRAVVSFMGPSRPPRPPLRLVPGE